MDIFSSSFFHSVKLPLAVWIDWLICVPLIAFMSIYIDDSTNMSRADIVMILSFAGSIVFGLAMASSEQNFSYFVFLTLSCGCLLVAALTTYFLQKAGAQNSISCDIDSQVRQELLLKISAKQKKLGICLLCVMPPFPVLYMLGIWHVLEAEQVYAGLIVTGYLSKSLFMWRACYIHAGLVDELTAKLANEVNASNARRDFLRFVFHEVRVPLNSMLLGLTVVSQSKALTPEEMEAVEIMHESTNFMTDTLNDVLSMQKMEEGKLALVYGFFSIRAMIKRAVGTLRGSAQGKQIQLVAEIGDIVPDDVKGDKFRLEHVVANLLSNAVKFSPTNTKIIVSVDCQYRNKPFISNADNHSLIFHDFTIAVIDQGPGIPPDEMKHLFQPFHQVRAHEMQQGQGTGLGLSLAKDIVTMHGGDVTCESTLNVGTRFIISIPLEVRNQSDGKSLRNDTELQLLASMGMNEGDIGAGGIVGDPTGKSEEISVAAAAAAAAAAASSAVFQIASLDQTIVSKSIFVNAISVSTCEAGIDLAPSTVRHHHSSPVHAPAACTTLATTECLIVDGKSRSPRLVDLFVIGVVGIEEGLFVDLCCSNFLLFINLQFREWHRCALLNW